MERFELAPYFSLLSGSELDGARSLKDKVVAWALERAGLSPEEAVMVGDRAYDVRRGRRLRRALHRRAVRLRRQGRSWNRRARRLWPRQWPGWRRYGINKGNLFIIKGCLYG